MKKRGGDSGHRYTALKYTPILLQPINMPSTLMTQAREGARERETQCFRFRLGGGSIEALNEASSWEW
jgi:hypothetical protein